MFSNKPRLEFSFITPCPPRTRRRNPWLLALLLAALLVAMSGIGDAASAPLSAKIRELSVENGLLSLEVEDAPLATVLRRISEEADFRLELNRELQGPVTRSFDKAPLDKALLGLLDDISILMVHAPAPGALHDAPGRLSALYVLGEPVAYADAGEGLAPGPPPAERLRQVQALSDEPGVGTAGALAEFLARDEDPLVRRTAALGLGKLGVGEAQDALIAALWDEDAWVRKRAVQGLGRTWGYRAVEPLSEALQEDGTPSVRRLAAKTLGRIGGEEAVLSLIKARSDTDRGVRETAAAVLARLEGDTTSIAH